MFQTSYETIKFFFRDLHSSNCPIHGSRHPSKPRINRLFIRLLHGSKCSDLQALRLSRDDESMAYSVFPLLFFPDVPHFHPPLAVLTLREAESVHARVLHCRRIRSCTVVPNDGTSGPKAPILGCPVDAMDSLSFDIP